MMLGNLVVYWSWWLGAGVIFVMMLGQLVIIFVMMIGKLVVYWSWWLGAGVIFVMMLGQLVVYLL